MSTGTGTYLGHFTVLMFSHFRPGVFFGGSGTGADKK